MDDRIPDNAAKTAISVSELNRTVRTLLEKGVGRVWVEGEMSNLSRPASGHVYFSLKDDSSQIRCAWFKQRQRGPSFNLKNGDQILAYGQVSIYEARGDYQLIVERLETAGEGQLRRQLEALKKKLAAEGLFDEKLKRPLPALPRRVGVITSPSGAAVRDIVTVLKRRFPAIPVVIYPVAVQGDAAVPEITSALAIAARRAECDVLIVGRGGGSLEDLWAFNEEVLARAIRQCPIPVISAVGHEVDFTIADLVADRRAPTPSGAAEIVVPDQEEWLRGFDARLTRFATLIQRVLENRYQSVDWLAKRLKQSSPISTVARQTARLESLRNGLLAAIRHDLMVRERAIDRIESSLKQQSPIMRIRQSGLELKALQQRLQAASKTNVERLVTRLALAKRALNSVSPLATLQRGYAIVTDTASGKTLTDAAAVAAGANIEATLSRGRISAVVTAATKPADES
jgi:exodeoxyribonuclease VII large subunit